MKVKSIPIFLLIPILTSFTVLTQSISHGVTFNINNYKNYEIKILCDDYTKSKSMFYTLLQQNQFMVDSSEEDSYPYTNEKFLKAKIRVTQEDDVLFNKELLRLGNIDRQKIYTLNPQEALNQLTYEINSLNTRKEQLQIQINQYCDSSVTSSYQNGKTIIKTNEATSYEDRRKLFQMVSDIDNSIQEKKIKSEQLKNQNGIIDYQIELVDKRYTPQNSSPKLFKFVNMPGFSYSILQIDNPRPGYSAASYSGPELKYMWTDEKWYIQIGSLKNANPQGSSQYDEFFLVGFGQDVYPMYYGQGKREWFNLYTGYMLGTIVAFSSSETSNKYYGQLHLGIEIYKNNFLLLDFRLGYFLPLESNRHLRGLMSSLSFNFVF